MMLQLSVFDFDISKISSSVFIQLGTKILSEITFNEIKIEWFIRLNNILFFHNLHFSPFLVPDENPKEEGMGSSFYLYCWNYLFQTCIMHFQLYVYGTRQVILFVHMFSYYTCGRTLLLVVYPKSINSATYKHISVQSINKKPFKITEPVCVTNNLKNAH